MLVASGIWCLSLGLEAEAMRWFLEESLLGVTRAGRSGRVARTRPARESGRPLSVPAENSAVPSTKPDESDLDTIVRGMDQEAGRRLLERIEAVDLVQPCRDTVVAGRKVEIEALVTPSR